MTLRTYTTAEKLMAVEALIEAAGQDDLVDDILRAIAQDLRSRMNGAPSVALCEIERRIVAVHRSKTVLGYEHGAMRGVAEEVISRWPILKQALERFGATPETAR